MSNSALEDYLTNSNLQDLLYTYQKDCVDWMDSMVRKKQGIVLSLAMGMGKTICCCFLLQITLPRNVLCVCPTSTIFNVWIRNLLQYSFYYHVYYLKSNDVTRYWLDKNSGEIIAGNTYPFDLISQYDQHPYKVFVTNYYGVVPYPGVASRGNMSGNKYEMNLPLDTTDPEVIPLKSMTWDLVLADEVHAIANGVNTALDEDMKRDKQLRYYRMSRLKMTPGYGVKIGLTGTPIQNRISDVVSILTWVGVKFTQRVTGDEIRASLKLHMWRITENDLHPAMRSYIKFPEIDFEEISKDVIYESAAESDVYKIVAGKLVGNMIPGGDANPYSKVVYEENPLTRTTRECCLSADINMFIKSHNKKYQSLGIVLPTWRGTNSKMTMIANDVASFSYNNRSFICFFHYYEEEAAIMEKIAEVGLALGIGAQMGYYYFRINGKVEPEDRDIALRQMKSCIEQGFRCICFASIASSSDGLNMQFMDTCIIPTSDWNPGKELQAIKRMHRIGQTKLVRVYRYVHRYIVDAENTKHIDLIKEDKQMVKIEKFRQFITNTENAAHHWPIRDMPGFPGEKAVTMSDLSKYDNTIDPETGLKFLDPQTVAQNVETFYKNAGVTTSSMQYVGGGQTVGYQNGGMIYQPPPINNAPTSHHVPVNAIQQVNNIANVPIPSNRATLNRNTTQDIDIFDFNKYSEVFNIMSKHYEGIELYLRTAIYIDYLYNYNMSQTEVTTFIDELKTKTKEDINSVTDIFIMEDIVESWYKHFAQEKVDEVDDILMRYINCESELFNRLYKKYVDVNWVNIRLWFYNVEGEKRMNQNLNNDIPVDMRPTQTQNLDLSGQPIRPMNVPLFNSNVIPVPESSNIHPTKMSIEELRTHRLSFFQPAHKTGDTTGF